ncbi:MAG TPA: hypothetical protein VHH88_09270, partial [Verrucomicrobiae bacterium]|nr:hypothetical protein [Verrucomicrobiae bacterium]
RVIRGAAKSRAAGGSSIVLYDPAGRTAKALSGLGLSFHRVSSLSVADLPMHCLVIGADAWDAGLSKAMPELKRFVNDGGRVLCLKQDPSRFDPSWLPEPVTFFSASANDAMYPPRGRPFSGNMNINPERPWHPVFRGLDRNRLAMWSDYTGWDETKPGFPRLYPVTAGFKLSNAGSLARTAVLADYDRGLEGIGLCEMFSGKGSVILSGFDLVARAGLDPAADRLLWNLVTFAASATGHEIYPLIQKPIEWGNYATERGVITGPANGLIVNADWVRPATNPNAEPLTQAEGAWNTRPGDEFAPHGRRIFGPYGYSTSSSLREKPASDAIGRFWARIPSGTREMTTTVENRSKGAQRLTIFLDGKIAANESVPTSGVVNIQTPITAGSGSVAVMFEGSPELVLLSTRFK